MDSKTGDRLVVVTTVGFMCQGMISTMGSFGDLGWVAAGGPISDAMSLALGCWVLSACAILGFFYGRTIDTLIFAGAVAFELIIHSIAARDTPATSTVFSALLMLYFLYLWLGSLKASWGWARWLYLLSVWVSVLGHLLMSLTGVQGFILLNACASLVAAAVALYLSAAEVINHGWGKTVWPTGYIDK